MPSSPSSGVGKAILIAAILSLLVTAVRLYGELEGWNPTIWNREPGGGGSPLGVSWLMLPFGFWFGRRLAKGGSRPGPTGKALLLHVVGIGLVVGVFALAINFLSDWHQRAYLINGGAVACGLLALFAGMADERHLRAARARAGGRRAVPVDRSRLGHPLRQGPARVAAGGCAVPADHGAVRHVAVRDHGSGRGPVCGAGCGDGEEGLTHALAPRAARRRASRHAGVTAGHRCATEATPHGRAG
jgi:hypothetical protein